MSLDSVPTWSETIKLQDPGRATGNGQGQEHERGHMMAFVKFPFNSFDRVMGMDDATRGRNVEEYFHKKLRLRLGQKITEFEKAVLDLKTVVLNVELTNLVWHLCETLVRQQQILG